ncbi:sulfate ABC transporter substrate-binding protein [Telmatocola sphagniphila]|uniref:Sulfate ABC transporter substrate-binding protein n=1 Tax=Telmatocola sphagniphila TaxID=1123043 RepID=A0A8E6B693_9BACT|nr:sulfate ABC transporter substrate-binding protein [Telmatocola sphagniphila]QVL32667.1 sulfate ABC transporter substrate-binding protein [Telmatocola sphagniphila]
MTRKIILGLLALYLLGSTLWILASGVVRTTSEIQLLNVACDPTRELWKDINERFIRKFAEEKGQKVSIRQSHGGSGSQARAVIDGLDADVITLALWSDTDAVRKAGLIEPGWEDRLPNRSLPYVSTIVFVVRKGNPKGIKDWSDLTKSDISVITPNPKTSGNGKWSFLAAWGAILKQGGTENDALDFVTRLYKNVPVLDAAARGATMTFATKKIGDVHLTWENEAYLEAQEAKGELEIIYPKTSILAEPHVAVVDANVIRKKTKVVAEEYLKFLYTEEAQEVIAQHFYRPTNEKIWKRYTDRFPPIDLFPSTLIAPNWDAIQKKFFAENGVFDGIYARP